MYRGSRHYIITTTLPAMDNTTIPHFLSKFRRKKEKTPINQMLSLRASSMQRVIQVVQRSCITACKLMCLPFDSLLFETIPCFSAQPEKSTEDKDAQARVIQTLPSTILIVNISNSTLINSVIGNNAYPPVTERQPLMQQNEQNVHGEGPCSYCHGQQGTEETLLPQPPPSAEHLSISIQSSQVNYVIIGDNNYMHVEQSQYTD